MSALAAVANDEKAGVSAENFKSAMRHLAGGVSVITSGRGADRNGFTATSVSSLSADPAALIVCVNRNCSIIPTLRRSLAFGVNILGAGHRGVADRFAGRCDVSGADRFDGADWLEMMTGVPLMADALAAMDCTLDSIVDWQTHSLVIGRVEAVQVVGGPQALLYWRGQYIETPSG